MNNTHSVLSKYSGQSAKLLSGRFKWVKWLFYATALGNLIMLIGSALIFTQDFSVYDAEVDFSSADWFLIAGGVLYTVAFIGSVIAFSMFSFRAMKNLHIWGSRPAEMAPGWTVGWYFIPFANLWKPFEAMTQIWDGTTEASSPRAPSYPKIGMWWVFWVLTNISANISFRLAMNADFSESTVKLTAVADIFSGVTGILATIIIIPILNKIAEMQDSNTQGGVFE